MINAEIDPNNVYCLIMKRAELDDLIKIVEWFARTESELSNQVKWKWLYDDLVDVRKQQSLEWSKEDELR